MSYSPVDTSEGGLAFRYRNKSEHEYWIGEEREIDLFGEGFFISDLQVRIVSDKAFDHCDVDESFNNETRHFRRPPMLTSDLF